MVDPDAFGFIVTDIARMSRAMLERRIAAASLGVTPGEARTLLHIAAREGRRQTQIAERMGVEPMTACSYIDRLEKQGLVVRETDPDDRRAKKVRTTDTARQLIDAVVEQAARMREQTLDGLDPAERETLMAALRRARSNLARQLSTSLDDDKAGQ